MAGRWRCGWRCGRGVGAVGGAAGGFIRERRAACGTEGRSYACDAGAQGGAPSGAQGGGQGGGQGAGRCRAAVGILAPGGDTRYSGGVGMYICACTYIHVYTYGALSREVAPGVEQEAEALTEALLLLLLLQAELLAVGALPRQRLRGENCAAAPKGRRQGGKGGRPSTGRVPPCRPIPSGRGGGKDRSLCAPRRILGAN